MSRLSRFLPKFLRGDKDKAANSAKSTDKSNCKIIFLDETEYFLPYKGGLKGLYILDKVYEQLNLFERDYFGLRFIDQTGQPHWLDSAKSLSSQVKGCNLPYTLYFGVKFYPADPCKLKEEITRYQFFLQVKRDVLHGRLPVAFEEAAELFAYAVQSELGDYDSQSLPPGYVSEFQCVPNQTEELEEQIAVLHRRLCGTVPPTAELKFLDKVKWLDMYGVDLHPVLGEANTEYFLGLTPTGIVVYKNKTKVGNYFWPRITKVTFKAKVFIVKVKDKINDEHVYAFELMTKPACKHLWKCCVEHHAFFRLNQLHDVNSRTGSKPFRSTAKHRNSGRSDRQNNADQRGREQPRVLRVQSRRQARRAMSDTRLNQGDYIQSGIQYSEGHVTMVVTPETVKGSRHRSLPDLKGRESPTSTRSAPWENNMDAGLYTSGRESPVSVTQSENVNYLRKHRGETDSEGGGHRRNRSRRRGYDSDGGTAAKHAYNHSNGSYGNVYNKRSGYDSDTHSTHSSVVHRRKYFPSSRKGSDNESDVSLTRRRRREGDSGSESDISPKYTARQRQTKSVGPDTFEQQWNGAMQSMYLPNKENRPNGSIPSIHSAPGGEARQKKMRRRRSKSPGNKRPPEELRQHIEFDLVDPGDVPDDQLREIPYVNIETKAEPFKVKYSPKTNRHRYRSPKRKSFGDVDPVSKGGYISEDPPPPYSHTPDRTPEPTQKHKDPKTGGYYSDTGSFAGSLPRGRINQPSNYAQQYNNSTNNTNNNTSVISQPKPFNTSRGRSMYRDYQKHIVADIRSIPQFHENLLFYEPNNSPRPRNHTLHRYHPPPTAVFKPIDGIGDHNGAMDQASNNRLSSAPEMTFDLESGDEGQGQDIEEERNRDSGLNSSQGSSSVVMNTPPRTAPGSQRTTPGSRFGTQDAIARLYSSPAGTRRMNASNAAGNQSALAANRNVSFNQNNSLTNQKPLYSQSPNSNFNTSKPSNSFQSSPQVLNNSYGGQNRQINSIGSENKPQQNYSQASRNMDYNQTSRNLDNRQAPRDNDYNQSSRNQDNFNHAMSYGQQSQNGYGNHSNTTNTSTSNYASLSSREQYTSQKPSYNNNNYPPQSTGQNGQPLYGGQTSTQGQRSYQSSSQNSSHNQSGIQNGHVNQSATGSRQVAEQKWQYVMGNGDTEIETSGYIPSPSMQKGKTGSISPYSRSPASSPPKKNGVTRQIPLSPVRDHSKLSSPSMGPRNLSSAVMSPNFQSPDSAISSLGNMSIANNFNKLSSGSKINRNSYNISQNASYTGGQSSRSPQKEQTDNFSRVRTPAFGSSDVWTELNRDSGLNSSQGSSSVVMNTPPRTAPGSQRTTPGSRFGTQDAIARLYSSPAGTRRMNASNAAGNQSALAANRNVSFNQNNSLTNQKPLYSQSPNSNFNTSKPSNSFQSSPQVLNNSYGGQNRQINSIGSENKPQQNYSQASRNMDYNQTSRNLDNRQAPRDNDYNQSSRNQDNFNHAMSYGQQSQNGYGNHSNTTNTSTSNYASLSSREQYTSQKPSYNNNNYPPQSTGQNGQPLYGGQTSTQGQRSYQSSSQNSSHNQSGIQNGHVNQSATGSRQVAEQKWQYVMGNGDTEIETSGYIPSPSMQKGKTGSISPYSRSPASSPPKKNGVTRQIPLSPVRDHSKLSSPSMGPRNLSSAVMSPNFQSPDSAISSLGNMSIANNFNKLSSGSKINRNSYNISQNASYTGGQSSRSPQKEQTDNFSRVRTPAFGSSDVWTEL